MENLSYPAGWTSFETGMGICGIAWAGESIVRFRLPEADHSALVATMGGPPLDRSPEWVNSVIVRVRRHLNGEPQYYGDVRVILTGLSEFSREVYGVVRGIMPGEVITYGELAGRIGRKPGSARAVGHAMGRNPIPLIIPCHRVVGANRNLGGFSAHGGVATKRRLLEIEGIPV